MNGADGIGEESGSIVKKRIAGDVIWKGMGGGGDSDDVVETRWMGSGGYGCKTGHQGVG